MTDAQKLIALLKEQKRQHLELAAKDEFGITQCTIQRVFAEIVQQCIDAAEKVITT